MGARLDGPGTLLDAWSTAKTQLPQVVKPRLSGLSSHCTATQLIETSRGLLQTVCVVGCGRATRENYTIHVAARCLPSYEHMILSPQLSACFAFQTREISFFLVGNEETKFLPYRSAVFLQDSEIYLTLLLLSRDSFKDAVSVSAGWMGSLGYFFRKRPDSTLHPVEWAPGFLSGDTTAGS